MVSAAFPNRPFNLRDNVWFIGNEVNNNRSLVGFELWVDKVSYSPTFSGANAYRWMRLNGGYVHEYYGNGFDFRNGSNFLLANGTAWINHNADGTGSVFIEAAADFDILGATSLSITIGLPTIPRASTATFAGGTTFEPNTVQTINTNRASGSFTHNISYTFGSATGSIATGVASSTTWTPALSLLNQIPNNASGTGKITTQTYNGGSHIGTTDTWFTLNAPASVVPTWTSITTTDSVTAAQTAVGQYVQKVSKPSYTIVGAAAPYSATIATQKFTLEGQTVTGASGTVTTPIQASGTVVATHTIIDSRGRTKTQNTNLTVLPYSPPTIFSWSHQRSLPDGTVDADDGTSIRLTINAAASSLVNGTEKNSMQIKVYTKLRTVSTWTLSHTQPVTGLTYNSWFVMAGPFPLSTAYDIRVEAVDLFSTSAVSGTIASGAVFMHWSSTGLGIGQYHANGKVSILGDTYTSGSNLSTVRSVTDCNAQSWAGMYQIKANSGGTNLPPIPNAATYHWLLEVYIAQPTGVNQYIQRIWRMDDAGRNAAGRGLAYVRDRNGAGSWSNWQRADPKARYPTAVTGLTWNWVEGRMDMTVGSKQWVCDGVFTDEFAKYRIDYFYYTGVDNGTQLSFRSAGASVTTAQHNYQNMYISGTGTPSGAMAVGAAQFGVAAQSAQGHHGYFEMGNPMLITGNSQKTVSGQDYLVGSAAGLCQWGGWLGGNDATLCDGFYFRLSNQSLAGVAAGGWLSIRGI